MVLTCLYMTAQTGNLQTTFGTGGSAITSFGSGADEARNLAVQPDGKIVVVGHAFNGSNLDFAIARYNPDGSPDLGFGSGGKVMTDIAGGDDLAYGVGIQADGKIVVAGDGQLASVDFTVVRYTSTGALDPSFDGDGIATLNFISTSDDHVNYMLIQPDGMIVVNGYRNYGSNGDFAVARFTTSGAPDPGFGGGDGMVNTDINGGSEDFSSGVVIQSDGKLIVSGSTGGGGLYDFAAVRYNSDGSPDGSWGGGDGIVFYSIGGDDHCYASVLQSDGKVVLAGWADLSGQDDFAVMRLLTNGDLDPTFSGDGIATLNIGPGVTDDQAIGVTLQSNGKIILCGNSANGDFNVVRYDAFGNLDNTFNSDGIASADLNSGQNDFARKVKLGGYNILVAGWISMGGDHDFALAAFQNDFAPLPLLLTKFMAQKNNNEVVLEWFTSNEENIEQFIIERSADGVNYTSIGNLPPQSANALNKRYSFTDQHPLTGKDFYRLQIRDVDGKKQFSKFVLIRLDNLHNSVQVFPNPAADYLQVQVPVTVKGRVVLQVTDASGKLVRSMSFEATGNSLATTINLAGLTKGLYLLRIKGATDQLSTSFMKQ